MRDEQETPPKNEKPAARMLAFFFLLLLLALPISAGAMYLFAGDRGATTGSPPETSGPPEAVSVITAAEPEAEEALTDSATGPATPGPLEQPASSSAATASDATTLALDYNVARPAQPALPYEELTFLIQVGLADELEVSGDGEPLDYAYDEDSGTLLVTTAAGNLHVVVHNPRGGETMGNITIAPLKENRQWAWSHGFDDNVNLRPAIDLFRDHGWRATLFLIAKDVDDSRNEDWIADAPYLESLLAEGWSLGNHTWDHSCTEDEPSLSIVIRAQQRLEEIVARSERPDYPVIAFAAPCFSPAYDSILAELQRSKETAPLFNESGNNYYIAINPGAEPYAEGARQVVPFTTEMTIGRSPALELGLEEALDEFEWVAGQAAAGRPLWFNTFSHGDKEETIGAVLAHLYDRYGPGGSDTLWVAPSDEIYSYLRLRETATITRR